MGRSHLPLLASKAQTNSAQGALVDTLVARLFWTGARDRSALDTCSLAVRLFRKVLPLLLPLLLLVTLMRLELELL